jgi:hypothetical protein
VTLHERLHLDRELAELPSFTPDAARVARARTRAHAVLAARRRSIPRGRDRAGLAARILKWFAVAAIIPERRENG